MASRIIRQLISDLSGDEIPDGKGETVEFAYRGSSYSIDLNSKEAAAFDKVIAPYIANGTKAASAKRTRGVSQPGYNAKDVRAWAKGQGIDVPARGRIPQSVVDQYQSSN